MSHEQITQMARLVEHGQITKFFYETLTIAREEGDAEALTLALMALRIMRDKSLMEARLI